MKLNESYWRNKENYLLHFLKHRDEFGDNTSSKEYYNKSVSFSMPEKGYYLISSNTTSTDLEDGKPRFLFSSSFGAGSSGARLHKVQLIDGIWNILSIDRRSGEIITYYTIPKKDVVILFNGYKNLPAGMYPIEFILKKTGTPFLVTAPSVIYDADGKAYLSKYTKEALSDYRYKDFYGNNKQGVDTVRQIQPYINSVLSKVPQANNSYTYFMTNTIDNAIFTGEVTNPPTVLGKVNGEHKKLPISTAVSNIVSMFGKINVSELEGDLGTRLNNSLVELAMSDLDYLKRYEDKFSSSLNEEDTEALIKGIEYLETFTNSLDRDNKAVKDDDLPGEVTENIQ